MVYIRKSPKLYDVCIVGSGAAGGMAAFVLAQSGIETVMLEAGPKLNPERDFKQHMWPYQLARRGLGVGGNESELMAPYSLWRIEGEPYSCSPGTQYRWLRTRALGGRTNHWGQGAMRFSESDFAPFSSTGAGDDWPIRYQEVEPYYDRVERLIGVAGAPVQTGNLNNSLSFPIPKPRCTELLVKAGCKKLGIGCEPFSLAVLTRSFNGRAACHYCGQCCRGCSTASCFSSSQVLIPPALARGKLQLITNAMAREITTGPDGCAKGISYVDKMTGKEKEVHAKAVVLAASACESARLLMNSKCSSFPNGLANSSGVVGRYLMDSVAAGGEGYFSQLGRIGPHNHDGAGGTHIYIPKSRATESPDFAGGYHIEFGGGPRMPSVPEFDDVCDSVQGYGTSLKRECRSRYGKSIFFMSLGATVAWEENLCELDSEHPDKWGIPTLRFRFRKNENDFKMARHMQQTMRSIVEAAGGCYLTNALTTGVEAYGMYPAGSTFHELGTVRMGNDPRRSALNSFCQAHDLKNLFVVDGGCFVSSPDKTPTLTILALSWRASEYLVEQSRKGNLS